MYYSLRAFNGSLTSYFKTLFCNNLSLKSLHKFKLSLPYHLGQFSLMSQVWIEKGRATKSAGLVLLSTSSWKQFDMYQKIDKNDKNDKNDKSDNWHEIYHTDKKKMHFWMFFFSNES